MQSKKPWSLVPVVILMLGLFVSGDAEAILDLKHYRLSKSAPEAKAVAENYVLGLRDGIVMFDSYRHKYERVKEKFCINDAKLNSEKTIAI